MGIIFPPSIFLLEFKSREELMLQPQTAAEHQDDILSTSSSSSESSSSSSSSDTDSDEGGDQSDGGVVNERLTSFDRRRISTGSNQSLHLGSIFHSRRRRRQNQQAGDIEMAKRSGCNLLKLKLISYLI